MNYMIRVKALSFGIATLLAAHARAEEVSFEPRFAAAAPSTSTELAPLPTVALAPSGLSLPAGLADALQAAVEAELARVPDGAQFQVMTRHDGERTRWVLATVTKPRKAYVALVPTFVSMLFDCLHTLPNDSVELANTVLLLSGVPLPDMTAQVSTGAAMASMRDAWKSSKCVGARNDSPLLERARPRIVSAVEGMLTGEFDAKQFRGQGLLDLIGHLSVLFFDRQGLWSTERETRLRSLLRTALDGAFLDDSVTASLLDASFPSFWSWALAAARARPLLSPAQVAVVAEQCSSTIVGLRDPFGLRACVEAQNLSLSNAHIDGQTTLIVTKGK